MLTTRVPARPTLALIGAAASWGIATAISKRAVDEMPPLSFVGPARSQPARR